MFVLGSDITIGQFRFSGVNGVWIRKSIHTIVQTAIITLPSIAKIVKGGKVSPEAVIAGRQFNDGDPVSIKLGYNSNLREEFRGFVKIRNLNMPLQIECEGYSWLLRRNVVNGFWSSITVKDLLEQAVSGIAGGYQIQIQCETDLELNNVWVNNMSGFDVIEYILKYTDGCLTCFFVEPDVLWCGLAYTAYANGVDLFDAGAVGYRLGYNAIKDNCLKERDKNVAPVRVSYSRRLSTGTRLSESSDVFKRFVNSHRKLMNHIKNAAALRSLANEKAYQLSYSGYEGYINAFLEPYAQPGFVAYIADDRYPERDGNYLVESTAVQYGLNGARRIVEIGPRAGFAK